MTQESTPLQKAWFTINKLKQKLQNQQQINQPIAIVGLSCRFSQTNNKDEFWQLLQRGKNVITNLPEERWQLLKDTHEFFQRDPKHPYWGSFLKNITEFDAYFFGITPREALHMDLQQRMLLEMSYEAFEDAGLTFETLAESNTGVFVSLYANAFGYLQKLETDLDGLYIATGNATSIAANRLSYLFDLRGPSIVVDTACSSSLVALHLACLNLQTNLCETALVSAANINLFPSVNLMLAQAKMLSPDGQCKTFDADANGYVQGEGGGAIVLKTLSKALADKDRIYGVIMASGVNQDGKTNGLTAPNGLQQEKLFHGLYDAAKINAEDISYVECHGTGTFLGDPIEVQALGEVISKQRDKNNPCWIGSVKTNLGHLEPAAGIASVIKVALALKNSQIPPHLNVKKLNPLIEFNKYFFRVPQQMEPWPKYGEYRMAAVSGFGFGGTNAHLVIRELTDDEKKQGAPQKSNRTEIFTLSAKDPEALKLLVDEWRTYLKTHIDLPLNQICYNAHLKRSHLFHRIAVISNSTEELLQALNNINDNNVNTIFINSEAKMGHAPRPASPDNELENLAINYVTHNNVDWKKIEESRVFSRIEMPLYPWQRKEYWPHLGNKQKQLEEDEINLYPFQGETLSSPLKTTQFNFILNTKAIPELLDTYNICHAGYYIEMLAYAIDQLRQDETFSVEDLHFASPIIVPNDMDVNVQLILKGKKEEIRTLQFYSLSKGQTHWKEHAKAKLLLKSDHTKKIEKIDTIQKRATQQGDADQFYARVRSMEMPADGSVRWVSKYWLGDNEILCEFKPPVSTNSDPFKLKIHFSVIDACIQALFLVLPKELKNPYVASEFGLFHFYGMRGKNLYLYAKLKKIHDDGDEYDGDWYLINEHSEVIASCENLKMKKLSNNVKIGRIKQVKEQLDVDWAPLSLEKRRQKIMDYLREQVAIVFAMPQEDVDVLQSLAKMGIDSLMALVLMRAIETGLGVNYSMQAILQGPSIADIVDFVVTEKENPGTGTLIAKEDASTSESIHSWIAFRKPKHAATKRLFCFPYGGAGASIYRDWSDLLPDDIEVCPIQLPGREDRIHEPAFDKIEQIVDALIPVIKSESNLPFAFFGHSFGSLIAFELAHALRHKNLPHPEHLYLSAFPDPKIPSKSLENLLAQIKAKNIDLFNFEINLLLEKLNENELMEVVNIFNEHGLTDYSVEAMNAKTVKLLLPIFIADMNLVKNYRYRHKTKLDIPMTIFYGTKDTWVSSQDVAGWADQTSQTSNFQEIRSGHLFIQKKEFLKQVLECIVKTLKNK